MSPDMTPGAVAGSEARVEDPLVTWKPRTSPRPIMRGSAGRGSRSSPAPAVKLLGDLSRRRERDMGYTLDVVERMPSQGLR